MLAASGGIKSGRPVSIPAAAMAPSAATLIRVMKIVDLGAGRMRARARAWAERHPEQLYPAAPPNRPPTWA